MKKVSTNYGLPMKKKLSLQLLLKTAKTIGYIEPPKNQMLLVPDFRECEHFGRNTTVSAGVSRMGKTGIIFTEPGAKVNSSYYFQHVFGEGLLPDIRA